MSRLVAALVWLLVGIVYGNTVISTQFPLEPIDISTFLSSKLVADAEFNIQAEQTKAVILKVLEEVYRSSFDTPFEVVAVYTPNTFGLKIFISSRYPDATLGASVALSAVATMDILMRQQMPFNTPTLLMFVYDVETNQTLGIVYYQYLRLLVLSSTVGR